MQYLIKTPWWLKKLIPGALWSMPPDKNKLFLSFDDGPHPVITPFVLDLLKKFQAKATFFCVGDNVVKYPDVYQRILQEGHAVGNHTHHHLNGWKTPDKEYLDDIALAAQYIQSPLFRPPYGRISRFQRKQLTKNRFRLNLVMWSVLSGDFDPSVTKEKCLDNVLLHTKPGDIIVFHDSEKAKTRMEYALPVVLEYFTGKGFQFDLIRMEAP